MSVTLMLMLGNRWPEHHEYEKEIGPPIDPVLVCEVTYERIQSGRFRHAATFVRWRDDRDPRSCTFEQVGAEPPSWAEM